MARRFAGSTSTDKISFASIATNTLRSRSTWVYLDAIDGTSRRLLDRQTGNEIIAFRTDAAGKSFCFFDWTTSDGRWEFATADIPVGSWFSFIVTYDGGATTNDAVVYIDGISVTLTEGITPSGNIVNSTGTLDIGNNVDNNRSFDGAIAEFALWDRILNAGEIAALAKGFSPIFFDPSFYAPLIGRNSPETQPISSTTGTVTGAVVDPHPRIIYPTPTQIRRFTTAAAAGATWPGYQSPFGWQ